MGLRTAFFSLVLFGIFAFPHVASAAIPFLGPIIPKELGESGCPIGWPGLIVVVNRLISFAITAVIVFVAPLMIAWAGFLLVVNPVSPEGKNEAKQMLWQVAIGVTIALSAYLLVNAILVGLTGGQKGVSYWTSVLGGGGGDPCLPVASSLNQAPPGGVSVVGGGGGAVGGGTCSNCVDVTGIPHKSPAQNGCDPNGGFMNVPLIDPPLTECQVNATLLSKLQSANTQISGAWQVTEMWPPTLNHKNACHGNGTCVDAASRGADIYSMAKAFISVGLNPVYEFSGTAEECAILLNQFSSAGVTSIQILNLNVEPHFSVYTDGARTPGCVNF